MRLQSPELHTASTGGLDGQPLLHNALCLPDSLEVLVGETFTAYLGVLNVSRHVTIRRLSVSAHLQTPSQRFQLPSPLEGSGVDIPMGSAIDTIVSHAIEEPGQHILRVEVSYSSLEGGTKTFRKFYRFQVVNPLTISELTIRAGDNSCLVSISVEYRPKTNYATPIVVSDATFLPTDGITAQRIGNASPFLLEKQAGDDVDDDDANKPLTATQILDASGFLSPGSVIRYLFQLTTTATTDKNTTKKKDSTTKAGTSSSSSSSRGIAAGDKLGTAMFTWRKSMGETGRIASSPITCPSVAAKWQTHNFVMDRSGLSVDVAASAAWRNRNPNNRSNLSVQLPVTVEPLNPPRRMVCNQPTEVQFFIVNHSDKAMSLQLQFRLSYMSELTICGPSFVSLGTIPADGGSIVTKVQVLPLATGLLRLLGCWIVDLASDQEIAQPPLFEVFVDKEQQQQDTTTSNTAIAITAAGEKQ